MESLETLSLPVGWSSLQQQYFQRNWLMVLVGWALTTLAGSLGAPFWFDTLNRIMNVRAAGKVPDQAAAKNGGQSDKSDHH